MSPILDLGIEAGLNYTTTSKPSPKLGVDFRDEMKKMASLGNEWLTRQKMPTGKSVRGTPSLANRFSHNFACS